MDPAAEIEELQRQLAMAKEEIRRLSADDGSAASLERKYRTLFDSIDEGFCVIEVTGGADGDPVDYRFLQTNASFERQTGLVDAVGKRMRELAPAHEEHWFERYDRIARMRVPDRFEDRADALGRWYDVYAFPIDHPELRRVGILFRDIIERKRAEIALRETEERQAFLLALGDALRALTSAGEKIAAAARMVGERLNASRVLWGEYDWERRLAHIFGGWFADDTQSFPTVMQLDTYDGEVLGALRAGETVRIDDVGLLVAEPAYAAIAAVGVQALLSVPLIVDGILRVNVSIHQTEPRHWTDEEVALVGEVAERLWAEVVRARTEDALRESEEKYRSLFDTVSQGLAINQLVRDESGQVVDARFLDLNPAYEAQTGFQRDQAIGRLASEIFPSIGRFWLEMAERVVEGGQAEYIERYVADTGSWFAFHMMPFEGSDQFVVLYDDITDRKQAEAAQRENEERQAFLLQLSDALRPLADAGEIQAMTAKLLGEHLRADRAMYGEVTGEPGTETGVIRGQFVRPAAPGRPAAVAFPDRFTFESFGVDVMARRYSGEGLAVADVNSDPGFDATERAAWAQVGVQAAIVAPLVKGGRLVAELGVHSETPRAWTDAEISLVREVGERTWAAAERARAEASSRASEERLGLAIEIGALASWDWDIASDKVEWNDRHFELQGYEIGEVAPSFEAWLARVHPDDRAETVALIERARDRHQVYVHDFRTLRPDGTIRWCSARGQFFYASDGQPLRMIGVMEDITLRKETEAALRQRETDLARVQRIGQVGGLDIDVEHGLRSHRSPEYLRLHGLPQDGRMETHADWRARVHPDDRDAAEERLFAALDGTANSYDGEYRIFRENDGELRWIHARADIERDGQGKAVRLLGAHLDVTDQKRMQETIRESEERFTQFANASASGLWIRDAATLAMEYASPAVGRIYGVEPEQMLGDIEKWAAAIVPEDRASALAHIERARGGEASVHEFRIQRASDGAFRWIRNTDFPLQTNDHIGRIGGIAEDVSEQKLAAEHQAILLAELQHRVRNIMAILRSITARTADSATSVADYAALMAGRLATFARVQALLTRAANAGVAISTIVVDELAALAGHADQFEAHGPEVTLPPKAAETMTLAVHELTTNALKYGALSSPTGKVSVEWSVEQRGEYDWLVFDWHETAAPERPSSDTPRRKGFGSELIEGRVPYELSGKGEVRIEAGGAQCHIEFPLKAGASILDTDAPGLANVFGGAIDMTGEADLTGQTILIVEDEYYLAADTARALKGAGADILGPCATEEGARGLIRETPPTGAVLDINLQGGRSFDLARDFLARDVPFLFITGYDQDVIPPEFDGVKRLQKPVEFRTIIRELAELMAAA